MFRYSNFLYICGVFLTKKLKKLTKNVPILKILIEIENWFQYVSNLLVSEKKTTG